MRTTGQESNQGEGRPLGEGVANAPSDSTTTDTELVDYQDDPWEPGSGSDDPYGPEGDTTDLDDALADLSDDEAEDLVLDIFEDVYGPEAEQVYDDLQQSTGLDAHEILDVIFSTYEDSGSYGDGDTSTDGLDDSDLTVEADDDWYEDSDPFESDTTYDTDLDSSTLPDDGSEGPLSEIGAATADLFDGTDDPASTTSSPIDDDVPL